MKIKRLYLLGAWLLLGVSASAQITSIQPQPQQVLSQARNLSLPDTYLIVGDTEANTHAVSALKTLLAGKHSDKNGFRIYIGEKGDKAIRKFARQIPNHKEGYYLAINDKDCLSRPGRKGNFLCLTDVSTVTE